MTTRPVEARGAHAARESGGAKARAPRLVTVPRSPDRLVVRRGQPRRDSLFGNVTAESAGRLDVLLVLAGVGLVMWWLLVDRASPSLMWGIGSVALGTAIPARDALHALDRRWARVRRRTAKRIDAEAGNVDIA